MQEPVTAYGIVLSFASVMLLVAAFFLARSFNLLDKLTDKVTTHDTLLEVHGVRLAVVDDRLDGHDDRLDSHSNRLSTVERRP
jgi:hypothetical protein